MSSSWIRHGLCVALFLSACAEPDDAASDDEQKEVDSGQEADSSETGSSDEVPDPSGDSTRPKKKNNTQPEPQDPGKEKGNEAQPGDRPTKLPTVSGTCPEIKNGLVSFKPSKLSKPRAVQIWVDPAAKGKKGPLVFYWHGTTSNPQEALTGLGPAIKAITDAGGMVAAPTHDPESGVFPWFLVEKPHAPRLDDLYLADEILACAMKEIGIDTRRIHTLGLSAGALQSTQMSYRRANYIASSVLYSGGLIIDAPESEEPSNRFSSMIFHGGPTDIVVIKFKETSERFMEDLKRKEHFGFICDHASGHIIPSDGVGPAWKFLSDHPFGAASPYRSGLPDSFPSYCKLPAMDSESPEP